MIRYLLWHLTLAMIVLLIFGVLGVLIRDPSPHPKAMVITSGVYLICAGFTRLSMVSINYILKRRK